MIYYVYIHIIMHSPHLGKPRATPAAPGTPGTLAKPSGFPPPRPDGSQFCACFMARRLGRRVTALYERHLAPFGLGIGQFSLLGMALALPDSGISTLAEALDVDRTTLSRTFASLRNAGLVEQVDGADRRKRLVRATPAGRILWRQALSGWRAAQAETRGLVPDFDTLLLDLEKAGDALPAGLPDALSGALSAASAGGSVDRPVRL